MHGNIYYHLYDSFKEQDDDIIRKKLNGQPEYYGDIINIMHGVDYNSLEYRFAYALYSTYYQERQALIAQSDVEIKKLLFQYRIERISYKNAPQILDRISQYEVFIDNINTCEEILNFDEIKKVDFINNFNKLMIDYNIEYKDLDKILNNIIYSSKDVLKYIEEILLSDFFEINNK